MRCIILQLYITLFLQIAQCQIWRAVLKINSDVPTGNQNPADWYSTGPATYSNLTQEQIYVNSMTLSIESSNFKSLLIDEWKTGNINVEKVKLSFCVSGNEDKSIVFDTTSASWDGWLDYNYVELSSTSWTDIKTADVSFQGIYTKFNEGTDGRYFAIWHADAGCDQDYAWFGISTWNTCVNEWEEGQRNPFIFWSGSTTYTHLDSNHVKGDAFIMYIYYQPPTTNPTIQPTIYPTTYPTIYPTVYPSVNPTSNPTTEPTAEPTTEPTKQPTANPTIQPTTDPTTDPTNIPTATPTDNPSWKPTASPTEHPTRNPTNAPIKRSTTDGGEAGVGETKNTESGKKDEVNESSEDDLVFILLICIIVLLILVCCMLMLYCYKRRKHEKQKENINDNNNMSVELEKVKSVSTDHIATDDMATHHVTNQQYTVPMNSNNNGEAQIMNAEPDVYSDNTAIQMWLKSMGLIEYYDIFIEQGFAEQMATLSTLTDDDLQNIGITKLAHRKRILLQIENNKNMIYNNNGDGYNGVYAINANQMDGANIMENEDGNDEMYGNHENHENENIEDYNVITTTRGDDNNVTPISHENNNNDDDEYEYYEEQYDEQYDQDIDNKMYNKPTNVTKK